MPYPMWWRRSLIVYWCSLFFATGLCAQQAPLDSQAKQALYQNDYTQAIALYQQCLQQAQQHRDWTRTANAFIGIGVAHDRSGNYEEALRQYFQAAAWYERAGNEKKQAGTLKNIGNVYRVLRSFDKSYAYFELAYQTFLKGNDSTGLANVLNDMGILFMDTDSSRRAIGFFKKVIEGYERYATGEVKAYALNNLGVCYAKQNDYEASYRYYTAALQAMQQLNSQYGMARVYINLGDLFNRQKKYTAALAYNQQGVAIAAELGLKELLLIGYDFLAQSYTGLNNFKQAAQVRALQLNVKDSIFKEESARSYAEMETRFQTERKQKEILLLQQENTIKAAALTEQQRTKYFLLAVLSLIGVVALLLYRSARLKQKSNTALALLNSKLEEANASKVKLFSILSHDLRSPISNLFSFLHLRTGGANQLSERAQQAYDQKITMAAEALLEAMEDVLIWSKSQMEHFTPVHETVWLAPFLDEIVDLHATAAANKNMGISKSCPDGLYLQTDPNFLKIILRNLTSNAIKFTPAGGAVCLEAFAQDERIILTVRDNGPGIAAEDQKTLFEWNSIRSDSSGLGLKLAKEFTEKLGGAIAVQSAPGQGTTFILSFPPDGTNVKIQK